MKDLTDADLYGFTPDERRVIHGGARGGWIRSPGLKTVRAVEAKTGLKFQSEQMAYEPRAFWCLDEEKCEVLSKRIKALPRRSKKTQEA